MNEEVINEICQNLTIESVSFINNDSKLIIYFTNGDTLLIKAESRDNEAYLDIHND